MTRILEHLYVGCLADAQRLSRGNPNRISTVVTICEQGIEHKATDVCYVHLPIVDDEPVPVRQFEAIMNAIAVSIHTGNVLIHCGVGISRSPILTAAFMHRIGYAEFDVAIEIIRQARPIIEPSKILVKCVKEILG
jgi:protein-tyrosine phosphatase